MTKQEFINKYKFIAIWQQILFGIPASVTLAQAIIESNTGSSTLSIRANNFFGIKAYSNPDNLPVFYANDDLASEPFRAYLSPKASFKDHSKFLVTNPRYNDLFLDQNYVNWANGLQLYGYATNPSYASTIKSVIETNNLQRFDFWGKNKIAIFVVAAILLALISYIIYIILKKK